MIPSKDAWTVIFNKRNEDWGSYSYDESEDALRIEVNPVKADHMEWLFLGFEDFRQFSYCSYALGEIESPIQHKTC